MIANRRVHQRWGTRSSRRIRSLAIAAPLALGLPSIAAAAPGPTTAVTTTTTTDDAGTTGTADPNGTAVTAGTADTTTVVTTTTTTTTTVVKPVISTPPDPATYLDRSASNDSPAPAPSPPRTGFYFGDTVQLGSMQNQVAVWNEMELGAQVLPRLSIGAGLNILIRPTPATTNAQGDSRHYDAMYAGGRASLAIVHRPRLDLGIDGYIGGGRLCLAAQGADHDGVHCVERQPMLVTESRVFVNYRIADVCRIGMAGGYRFVSRKPLKRDDRFRMTGPFVAFTVDFGFWG